MAARDFRSNPLAELLDLKPGEDFRSRGAVRLGGQRDPELSVPINADARVVQESLAARRGEFKRAATMLFHPEGAVHADAAEALRDLIPAIIRHHQQLRGLGDRSQGGFELAPAFSQALKEMAAPNGDLKRQRIGGQDRELVSLNEFTRGIKTICSLFRSELPQVMIASLTAAEWLAPRYREELPGIKESVESKNPKLQAARRLLGV